MAEREGQQKALNQLVIKLRCTELYKMPNGFAKVSLMPIFEAGTPPENRWMKDADPIVLTKITTPDALAFWEPQTGYEMHIERGAELLTRAKGANNFGALFRVGEIQRQSGGDARVTLIPETSGESKWMVDPLVLPAVVIPEAISFFVSNEHPAPTYGLYFAKLKT
jgi:hypothetical protein